MPLHFKGLRIISVCVISAGAASVKMSVIVTKTEIFSETGNYEKPVTSPPPAAAAAAAAGGDSREWSVMRLRKMLRDTRQQISELRQKTENALSYMQQVNTERRQQLVDIQSAKAQLNLIHSQLANIVSLNKEVTSSEKLALDESETSS